MVTVLIVLPTVPPVPLLLFVLLVSPLITSTQLVVVLLVIPSVLLVPLL